MQPEFEIWIWLDTHISSIIAKWLQDDFGYVCKSSFILSLHGLEDIEIYNKAKAAGNVILLTKDSDFPLIVERLGSPPKVINIKAKNMKSRISYFHLKQNIERCLRLLKQYNYHSIDLYLPS